LPKCTTGLLRKTSVNNMADGQPGGFIKYFEVSLITETGYNERYTKTVYNTYERQERVYDTDRSYPNVSSI
jgi:hypothetical protein